MTRSVSVSAGVVKRTRESRGKEEPVPPALLRKGILCCFSEIVSSSIER